ncbi:hypothetical protein [Streptomyces flaveolus]|uniref:hypothetical protein n=1 Tax=Streptomyces flaveolus TaxID=67297 RepID=UPI00380E6627
MLHFPAGYRRTLVRVPALEARNKLFAALVAASYPCASGLFVTVTAKTAADVTERIYSVALDVRSAAAEIRAWTRM